MRRGFATVIAAPSVIREGITGVLSSSEFRIVAAASSIGTFRRCVGRTVDGSSRARKLCRGR